jgi:methionyl-tRNA formyltransferase
MRLVFMGTPEFAVPSLKILLDNGYDIAAVVTAPDKPGGRQGLQQWAVKLYAQSVGLPVLQPVKLKDPDFIAALQAINADLHVVVAFRMLPEVVWRMPRLGTMNVHGSLLPKFRGAAPINWAIISGETTTGVTTFLLQHAIDTGDLLFQAPVPIGENDTAGELHDRMMEAGAALLLRSVQALENGTARPQPQQDTAATHAPKLFTETCRIDFTQSTATVHNFIRGLSPYPGAWTMYGDKVLKILRTTKDLITPASTTPGQFIQEGVKSLRISTADGYVQVLELQLEGKRRMSVVDFLNGLRAG